LSRGGSRRAPDARSPDAESRRAAATSDGGTDAAARTAQHQDARPEPEAAPDQELLRPYVPRLTLEWLAEEPAPRWRTVEGTLAFVDISGFTSMTERLAKRGKVGAEEVSDILDAKFGELLALSDAEGADLIKWGGDAVLLLLRGPDHAVRACRAAAGMVRTMRRIGRLRTSVGLVRLRMSVGVNSGLFHFFLVGDLHRELVLTGPAATITARMEGIAEAGEVVVSRRTAALLPPALVGEPKDKGFLLRTVPPGPPSGRAPDPPIAGLDVAACLPIEIRQHLLSGATVSEAEHRPITAAFLEWRGSDALLTQPGGEEATAQALDELMSTVQREADTSGVSFFETDINQDGGKVMLIGGAPRTSGHHEEGMLRAARAVVDAGQGGPLALRMGVNAGRVFAGGFGPPFRRTYSVKGDAVNLAARLMAKAPPGGIYATEAVLDRSRTVFATTALEPFMVKGKARPVQAWSVGEIESVRAAHEEHQELPLVGRESEMGALREALDAARASRGRVVELIAEPGMGKSRLVSELRAGATDLPVVSASCDAYGANTPYLPFRGLLRRMVGIEPDADAETAGARLTACVAQIAPDLAPWLPLMAIPIDASVEPTAESSALGEQFRKPRLEETLSSFLSRLAPGPLLFVFDDVHWMDEASASLLTRLARDLEDRAWLILALRTEAETGFVAPEQSHPVRLRLEPIDAAAAASALVAATEDAPLPSHVMDALTARAGGNPLFLQELLAAARGSGNGELPASVEEVVAAQIDELPPDDRRLLRFASVLGTRFDGNLLEAVLAGTSDPPDTGTWDRMSEFLVRESPPWVHFRHALIRDTAYEGLAFRRRQELHGRVGDAILDRSRAPEEQADVLSLHFLNAGRYPLAWRFGRIAGDRARAAYANVEAAQSYSRALEAAHRVKDVPPVEEAAVFESLGEARVRLGEFPGAGAAFLSSRALVRGDVLAEARLLLKVSEITKRQGRHPQALAWLRRADHLLAERHDQAARAERARLTVEYGGVRIEQGRPTDAIRWCRQAIPEAEASGARDALAHAYYVLDWALTTLGRLQDATNSEQALVIYEELGDTAQQAKVLNNLGNRAWWLGAWDKAVDYYDRARKAFERLGAQVDAAVPLGNIGMILSEQGRLPEAEVYLRQALRISRAAGDRAGVAIALQLIGTVAAREGRFDDALKLLADARAMHVEDGERAAIVDVDAFIVECLVLRGDGRAALALATETLARAAEAEASHLEPMLRRLEGEALALVGRPEAARESFDAALSASRGKDEYQAALTLEAMLRLPHSVRADLDEHELGKEHMAIFQRLGIRASGAAPV
jgi:class 3 adenylate cyclase/tetratricopeptide (TPR) repeat protein